MFKTKRKLQLSAAFTALIVTAFSMGCSGFFVDPTLTSLTVSPQTPTVAVGGTLQLTATGGYDDGSSKDISSSVIWLSETPTAATVSQNGGLLTGVTAGSAVITASKAAVSGQTTAKVLPSGLQSITLNPTNPSIPQGTTKAFTATGHFQDGSTSDISDLATWNSSNTDIATIDASGVATALSVTATSQTTITASLVSTTGTISQSTTLTVTTQ